MHAFHPQIRNACCNYTVTLSDAELAQNRVDAFEELKKHPFDDAWHRSRAKNGWRLWHCIPSETARAALP